MDGPGVEVRPYLSVIIPAYNEAASIRDAVLRSVMAARSLDRSFEVIVVDDCSTDGTSSLLARMAAEIPEIRVHRNSRNLGQGGSLDVGFRIARGAYVMHNGADCCFAPEDLPLLLGHLPSADVVVAVRDGYPGTSAIRRALSATHRLILFGLFGSRIRDCNFVQLYRREVLERCRGFSTATVLITVEKVLRARRKGFRIVQQLATYHGRVTSASTSASMRNILTALRDMLRLRLEFWIGRRSLNGSAPGEERE